MLSGIVIVASYGNNAQHDNPYIFTFLAGLMEVKDLLFLWQIRAYFALGLLVLTFVLTIVLGVEYVSIAYIFHSFICLHCSYFYYYLGNFD